MVYMINAMFHGSTIAQNMKLKRTKASYVMQDDVGFEETFRCLELPEADFSMLIDESTYVSVSQVLAIFVPFFVKILRSTMLCLISKKSRKERQMPCTEQ